MLLQPLLSTQTRPYCCRIPLLQVVIPPLEALALSLLLHTGPVLRAPSELDIFTHLFVALPRFLHPLIIRRHPLTMHPLVAGGSCSNALRFALSFAGDLLFGMGPRSALCSPPSAPLRNDVKKLAPRRGERESNE